MGWGKSTVLESCVGPSTEFCFKSILQASGFIAIRFDNSIQWFYFFSSQCCNKHNLLNRQKFKCVLEEKLQFIRYSELPISAHIHARQIFVSSGEFILIPHTFHIICLMRSMHFSVHFDSQYYEAIIIHT